MPVNLSIKGVPDDIAKRLRRRAQGNHRSLQGELMAILEQTVNRDRRLTPRDVLREVREAKLETPAESEVFVREDRDAP